MYWFMNWISIFLSSSYTSFYSYQMLSRRGDKCHLSPPRWQWSQNSEFCHIYIKCSLSSRHRVLPTTARILSFELIQLQLAWKVYSNTHIYIYTHKTTWTLLTVNSIGHQDSELDTAPFYNQLWMPFQRV